MRRAWVGLMVAGLLIVPACTSKPKPPLPTPVLSPASVRCIEFPSRALPIPPKSIETRMEGHLPQWLPPGLGMAGAWGPTGIEAVVSYRNGVQCARVDDYLVFGNAVKVGGPGPGDFPVNPNGPHVGPWLVARQSTKGCPGFSALRPGAVKLCLEYQAKVEEGVVDVQMAGIDRSVGDRIVQSIPL